MCCGAQNFAVNGFEQLCINYANETLQFYFNRHIFRLEQEEYAKEGLHWSPIDHQDNRPCLDLIAKKPHGLLHLLDDESNLPQTSDLSFLEKCHFVHGGGAHGLYRRPRTCEGLFLVRHYAGEVAYEVRNFLDKNRDLLRTDVIDMFIESQNPVSGVVFV